jgi:hypothetical protein
MTEETSTETQATATETGEQQETPKPKPTETVEFWKQKAREQEARAKANAEAATKLQQFEDRDKTEAQRLTERAEAAEKRAAEIEVHALRLEVAAEKGLTPAQAKRLVGSTREELDADAAELLDTFKPATDKQTEAVASSLDLGTRDGATPTGGSQDKQAADWLQSLTRH